jgi:hypothetical protein
MCALLSSRQRLIYQLELDSVGSLPRQRQERPHSNRCWLIENWARTYSFCFYMCVWRYVGRCFTPGWSRCCRTDVHTSHHFMDIVVHISSLSMMPRKPHHCGRSGDEEIEKDVDKSRTVNEVILQANHHLFYSSSIFMCSN